MLSVRIFLFIRESSDFFLWFNTAEREGLL